MKDYKNFWGSYAALVLGLFALLGGAGQVNGSLLVGGWFMVLGSIAYMSAKKRKLGLAKETTLRKTLELIAVIIIIIMTVLTKRADLVNDPFPNVVIPAWAVIAYFIAFSKTLPWDSKKDESNTASKSVS